MDAELLTVGDELLIGQVVNTNAAWMGERLSLLGVDVVRSVTLGDDVEAILRELRIAFQMAELVIVTGGLGPTHDDVTKVAVAEHYGVELRFDATVFDAVQARFERRGLPMPEINRTQAMVPDGFEVLPNPRGTAPGLWRADEAEGRTQIMVVLPGVPHEMEGLMTEEVLPRLRQHKNLRVIGHRTLLTTGIGESSLEERLGDLGPLLGDDARLASLPGFSGVRLRLTVYGAGRTAVLDRLDELEARLRARAGDYIYGQDEDTLEDVVGRLLREAGLTVAVAESCTGGHVLNRLTNVSGSSRYVLGGAVAYCNDVKQRVLQVDADALERHGAVSLEVAVQMARGVRARFRSDVGLSTTGIMGPTGGTDEKPVGTVWFGYVDADREEAVCLRFGTDRQRNKERASTAALDLLRRRVLDGMKTDG